MAKYRKKPVVIEAVKWDGLFSNRSEWPDWFNDAIAEGKALITVGSLQIVTLEGVMTAFPGDMVIRGVQGELYPCKADIFAATYEGVE